MHAVCFEQPAMTKHEGRGAL